MLEALVHELFEDQAVQDELQAKEQSFVFSICGITTVLK